ncbi:MAG: glycosyltransferase family 2 protein [Prochlorotrichaceae cyanobacterium]|jgi:glycosyltransferase involved in cell wall biosynthesis
MTCPGLVSIIIPAYNAAKLIGEALDSILQQTYKNWEVLVVEDGTKDETESICQKFSEQVGPEKVRYIRHTVNQGLSAARNTGITHANGQYLALLDHDDTWLPNHLAQLIDQLERTGAEFSFAPAEFFHYSSYQALGFHGPDPIEWKNFPSSLCNRTYIPASGVVIRNTVPKKVGLFDTNLKKVEDLDYWLRCVEAGIVFTYVPEVTNGYRQRNPEAMTSNTAEILEWHARVLRKNSFLKSIPRSVYAQVLARYHLGVVRRSLVKDPIKAGKFLYHSLRIAPMGSIKAVSWFAHEAIGLESRYPKLFT